MSIDTVNLLILSILWYSKSTSLPKLYYHISKRRGIHIYQLCACERHGQKNVLLKLDIKYLESCADLKICGKFLKFKPPNISVYQMQIHSMQLDFKEKLRIRKEPYELQ